MENKKNVVTLYDWFKSNHTDHDKRELFLYMDFALRYIHDRGCAVYTFNPTQIEILNNSIKQVKFNKLIEIPSNDDKLRQDLIDEDIMNSSTLQVLLYSGFPLNTDVNFIKSNFDKFETFLPETDIPYYRGVLERNASVYFTEYELERIKRDNEALEKELNELTGNPPTKDVERINRELTKMFDNDKINDTIYRKINGGFRESAFMYILLYPTMFLVLGLIISVIMFLAKYMG